MSRVANNPVVIPKGVEVQLTEQSIAVKGAKGSLSQAITAGVKVKQIESETGQPQLVFEFNKSNRLQKAMAGTTRALVSNMVTGVTEGFSTELQLNGVGYRAQAQGNKLNLTLGLSHPVNYELPEGITAETPSQNSVVIKGIDKQKVGQVVAEIRKLRPPEPYKGKGIKRVGECIIRKEAKKK